MSPAAWRFRSPPRERTAPRTPPQRVTAQSFLRFNEPEAEDSLDIESDSTSEVGETNSSPAERESKRARLAVGPKIGLVPDTIEDYSSQEPLSQNAAEQGEDQQLLEKEAVSPDSTPFLPPMRRWRAKSLQTPARGQQPSSSSIPPTSSRAAQFLPPPLFTRSNASPETPHFENRRTFPDGTPVPGQTSGDNAPSSTGGGLKQLNEHFKTFVPPTDLESHWPHTEERTNGIPTSPAGKFVNGGFAHLISSLILEMSNTATTSVGGPGSPTRNRHSRTTSKSYLNSLQRSPRSEAVIAENDVNDYGRRRVESAAFLIQDIISSSLPQRGLSNYGQTADGIVTLVDGKITSSGGGGLIKEQQRRVLLCGLPEGTFEAPARDSTLELRRPWWTVQVPHPGSQPGTNDKEEWMVVVRWNVYFSEA